MKVTMSQLEAFVSVVEHGGITGAANARDWSKSKVSKLLGELEDAVDVPLFYRSARGLTPTSEGRSFYQDTRTNLDAITRSVEAVQDTRNHLSGHLSVSAPLIFTRTFLNPAIRELAQENVTLDIALSDDRSDLDERAHDVYIRIGELEDGDYYAKPIGRTQLMLVASPDYLAQHYPQGFAQSDLLQADLLRYAQKGHAIPWRNGVEVLQVNPQAKLLSNNGEYLAEAAAAGMGITYLPDFLAQSHLQTGSLVRVLGDSDPLLVPIHILYFERNRQSNALKRFIEVVSHQVLSVCPQGCSQASSSLDLVQA